MGEELCKIVLLGLLLAAMLLVSMPFILALALLEPSRYLENVRGRYIRVLGVWFHIATYAG